MSAQASLTRHGRLLVIDDSTELLDTCQMVLEEMGQQVDISASGREAVERVRGGQRYDLVLCDVGMPEMDGWQVARQVRALSPTTKIFLLTGTADQIGSKDPLRKLVDGILLKPIDLEQLEQLLSEQLPASAAH
jgi:CheY-like chemotaxis protein